MAKEKNIDTKSKHIEIDSNVGRDELAISLQELLNKSNKDGTKSSFILDEDNPSEVTDWVSTGSDLLDLAISNRPHGGLPVGRISELSGLQGCVTEDTLIEVIIECINTKIISVGEVNDLLKSGKTVKVKTLNGEYTKISNFVNKGILDTYLVSLDNNKTIKVSKEHKFFTNVGWVECKDIIPNKHSILCDDNKYSLVLSVALIGKYKIVDITVEHPEHCYFGNGMLNHNTGKSLICAHIMRETQKKGGFAVYFDSEFAVDREFWKSFGVDVTKASYNTFITLEDLFTKIELCIGFFRKSKENKNKVLTILVDSIAGASVETEIESEHGVTGYNTAKSLILGKALRKIVGLIAQQKILVVFTNQLRTVLNAAVFQEKYTTPCGMALPFASSVRVRLSGMGKIKKGDEVIGMNARANVVKTRSGPNFRTADFEIHYDSGIQNLTSWLDFAKTREIITGTAAKYTWKRANGEELQFNTSKFVEIMNSDENLKEEFYQQICKVWIMSYRDPNSKIVEDTETVTEEEVSAPLE